MAHADRERRRSWCCRGCRRGAGVGGEEPVPSRSREAGLGGTRRPVGDGQFAERPHAAGLSAPVRGWDSWPGRRSHCLDWIGMGACTARRSSRLGRAGGRPAGGRQRPGLREPCVTAETAALGIGGQGEPMAWRRRGLSMSGEVVLLVLSGNSDLGLMLGAGDGRLGQGLGGFPLEEVVGHLKAQSTCF